MKRITILVPAYNESANIPLLIRRLDEITRRQDLEVKGTNGKKATVDLTHFGWEYLFVNDGSRDNTLAVLSECRLRNKRVNYLNLSRNFGKESALLAGMDFTEADAVIIMDADLQHPVEKIPELVYWWQEGFDDVYCRREERGNEPWLRKKLSLAFYSLLQRTTDIDILPNAGDFRLLSARVIRALRSLRETGRYTKGLYSWVGFNKKEITFAVADRNAGKSTFNIRSLFELAINGITSFTTAPLRFSSVMGIIVSLISLLYLVWIVVKTLCFGEPIRGFPTIMCTILLLGGVQLIVLGIVGEYIARIYNESKRRPVYIAESFNGEEPERISVNDRKESHPLSSEKDQAPSREE